MYLNLKLFVSKINIDSLKHYHPAASLGVTGSYKILISRPMYTQRAYVFDTP